MIGADPFSGHLFIFRGKRGDYFKGLYWDGSGMWLIMPSVLRKGVFVWPPIVDGVTMTLTAGAVFRPGRGDGLAPNRGSATGSDSTNADLTKHRFAFDCGAVPGRVW